MIAVRAENENLCAIAVRGEFACRAKVEAPGDLARVGVVGLSHRTADLDLRSSVSFAGEAALRLHAALAGAGVEECFSLSTCNRSEVYFLGGNAAEVRQVVAREAHVCLERLEPHLYTRQGLCAACHLFKVVSGLDSAVLGETEIAAQFKQAWSSACQEGVSGRMLDWLCQRALCVGKRIRTESDISRSVTSIGSLAVREAEERLGRLDGRTVVLLGAGQIAERVAKDLRGLRGARLIVINRTFEKAQRLARDYGGEAASLDRLEETLPSADVLFSCISAGMELPAQVFAELSAAREGRAFVAVDLGVPRTVPVQAGECEGITLVDVESLRAKCQANSERRAAAVPHALEILDEELERLRAEVTERVASPTIQALVQHAETVRMHNLERVTARLDTMDARDRKLIEDLTRRIVKGLLQAPIQELKSGLSHPDQQAVVCRLFGLDTEDQADERKPG
jgi:glutamyl-tRNA reductase